MLSLLSASMDPSELNQPSEGDPLVFVFFLFLFLVRFYFFISERSIPVAASSSSSSEKSMETEAVFPPQEVSKFVQGI